MMLPKSGLWRSSLWNLPSNFCWEAIKYTVPGIPARLGLDIIYIQAKRWENTVTRSEIQEFAGALQGKRARKGIFITTSDFYQNSHEYVSAIESKIILIDDQQLSQLRESE